MSKIVTSPSPIWTGTVVLSDPLTFPQLLAFEEAIGKVKMAGNKVTQARADSYAIPGIIPCALEWHLSNFPSEVTENNFPASPRIECTKLVTWLVREITALLLEAESVPNA